MQTTELETLLGHSAVRLVYLSCCYGATSGSQAALLDDDFLGLADAVARAGVPSVLGFHWPVSDEGAQKLRPVQLDVITLAKVAYALVNEMGFGLQRCFRLESRRKTFARIALIAQVEKLALAFYQSLLEQGSPEIALWSARCELAAVNRNDPTWLSPILIHQE